MLWSISFHQTPGLPEQLIAGRQVVYFRHFCKTGTVNHEAISDADVAHNANAYATADQLRAGLEFIAAQRTSIDVPLVLAGGDHGFGPLVSKIAGGLGTRGWATVMTEVIKDSGHYVADEQPESVADLIERYASL